MPLHLWCDIPWTTWLILDWYLHKIQILYYVHRNMKVVRVKVEAGRGKCVRQDMYTFGLKLEWAMNRETWSDLKIWQTSIPGLAWNKWRFNGDSKYTTLIYFTASKQSTVINSQHFCPNRPPRNSPHSSWRWDIPVVRRYSPQEDLRKQLKPVWRRHRDGSWYLQKAVPAADQPSRCDPWEMPRPTGWSVIINNNHLGTLWRKYLSIFRVRATKLNSITSEFSV